MKLESKSAKYICIIGGIILIIFFLFNFISDIGSTSLVGVITNTYEIEEYRVTNSSPNNNGDSPDDYNYRMYVDVVINGEEYQVLLNRETQYTFPSVGESINLIQHKDGKIYEERKVRDNLAQFVLLGFGVILLYGGITGTIKET